MINISLNKHLDYEVFANFHDFSVAGVNFGEKIKKDHLNININNYKKYIDEYYHKEQSSIIFKQNEIRKLLTDKQKAFFVLLKKVFGIDFEDKNFVGYISIFNCNPRYLDSKTFQIYYKKSPEQMLEVAFHESLHFAFFEYLDINFSDKIIGIDKNSGFLWEMSEIFNVIILNLPEFRNLLGNEERLFYPELQSKLNIAKEIWNSSNGLKEFVINYFKLK